MMCECTGSKPRVWRAEKDVVRFYDIPQRETDVKYAKTYEDMLILKDKGYTITELKEDE